MFILMTVKKLALRAVMGERMRHPFLPSGTCLLLPDLKRSAQRFQTNRRMTSKFPWVPIILTCFV